jgi:hypothetical protein
LTQKESDGYKTVQTAFFFQNQRLINGLYLCLSIPGTAVDQRAFSLVQFQLPATGYSIRSQVLKWQVRLVFAYPSLPDTTVKLETVLLAIFQYLQFITLLQ